MREVFFPPILEISKNSGNLIFKDKNCIFCSDDLVCTPSKSILLSENGEAIKAVCSLGKCFY